MAERAQEGGAFIHPASQQDITCSWLRLVGSASRHSNRVIYWIHYRRRWFGTGTAFREYEIIAKNGFIIPGGKVIHNAMPFPRPRLHSPTMMKAKNNETWVVVTMSLFCYVKIPIQRRVFHSSADAFEEALGMEGKDGKNNILVITITVSLGMWWWWKLSIFNDARILRAFVLLWKEWWADMSVSSSGNILGSLTYLVKSNCG